MGEYCNPRQSIAVRQFLPKTYARYCAKWWLRIADICILSGLALAPTYAAQLKDLIGFSLEQLGNIEITSVSSRPERLGDAAASISVITAEDIRCPGVTTLPERGGLPLTGCSRIRGRVCDQRARIQ